MIAPERMRPMKRRRAEIWRVLALAGLVGCQSGSTGSRRSVLKPKEPGLAMAGEAEPGVIVEKPPPAAPAFVERHPLFYKPREIYNNSGKNKIVKVAGATIVGVPMGIAGELKQIVVGAPAAPRGF
jgi:hypothetical protein